MIEDYEANIKDMLTGLRATYNQLEVCKPSDKATLVEKAKREIDDISNELLMFDSEIQVEEDASRAKQYKTICKTLQSELTILKNEFEMKKMAGSHIQDELDNIKTMSAEQLQSQAINHGDKLLAKRKERAQNILFTIKQANILVSDINDEIKEQNQRMMDMEEIIKDSQSALNRANEVVGYFAKAFYRDIILKVLIVLIAIAIIAVVIASVAKKKDIKPATTTTEKNTTTPETPVVKRLLQTDPQPQILQLMYPPEDAGSEAPPPINN